MSFIAADGAALVAAAIQAAIRERASHRTVAAVAAAVVGSLMSAATRPPPAATKRKVRTPEAQSKAEEAGDPAQLLESLRAVRRAQRARKKERRRTAKAAGVPAPPTQPDDLQSSAEDIQLHADAAGLRADSRGSSAAKPALAAAQLPDAVPPLQPGSSIKRQRTLGDAEHAESDKVSARASSADGASCVSLETLPCKAPSDASSIPGTLAGNCLQSGRGKRAAISSQSSQPIRKQRGR